MIFKLKPALKSYIWGGTKLKSEWGKVSEQPTLSESWELSFHKDGMCVIDGGEYDGLPISQVVPKEQWGVNCKDFPFFPVLNKLIDAADNLSVQVHPSDEYALQNENQFGKTEMWYVLDVDADAKLYMGLNRALTSQQFAQAISDNCICDYMNAVSVKAGETYFIPSGTLHAIGKGITLFEIQQNSSLTYRVYDYDRRDANGNPRELHVEKAKAVANLDKYIVPSPERGDLLGKCKYFSAYRYAGEKHFCNNDSFVSFTVVDGQVCANGIVLTKGETCFATAGEHVDIDGTGTYILTCVERE